MNRKERLLSLVLLPHTLHMSFLPVPFLKCRQLSGKEPTEKCFLRLSVVYSLVLLFVFFARFHIPTYLIGQAIFCKDMLHSTTKVPILFFFSMYFHNQFVEMPFTIYSYHGFNDFFSLFFRLQCQCILFSILFFMTLAM